MNVLKRMSLAGVVALGVILGGCSREPGTASFSPDGGRLVFPWAKPAGKTGLAVSNADGSGFHVLPHTSKAQLPSWSPDGRRILFFRSREEEAPGKKSQTEINSLWCFDTVLDRAVIVADRVEAESAWSPDGRSLAVLGERRGRESLVIYDVWSLRRRRRIWLPRRLTAMNIEWLPGQQPRLLVLGWRQGGSIPGPEGDLYLVQGDRFHRLTDSGDVTTFSWDRRGLLVYAREPIALSMDGEHIRRAAALWCSLDLRTGARKLLPLRMDLCHMLPGEREGWARMCIAGPTGQTALILYSSGGDGTAAGIYRVDPHLKQVVLLKRLLPVGAARQEPSSKATVVDSPPAGGLLLGMVWELAMPSWSADGRRLAVYEKGSARYQTKRGEVDCDVRRLELFDDNGARVIASDVPAARTSVPGPAKIPRPRLRAPHGVPGMPPIALRSEG
ncbi:MAG TPA: hypothetical protein VFJ58_08480 [Armatimonadota bacterium]|nr:hypothetical protein [Armatimonadota bacterium]